LLLVLVLYSLAGTDLAWNYFKEVLMIFLAAKKDYFSKINSPIFHPYLLLFSLCSSPCLPHIYLHEIQNLDLIKAKLAKASPSLMDAVVVNSLSSYCTIEKAEEIQSFFAANPLPHSEMRIKQSVESIRNSGEMLTRVRASEMVNPQFWA
jgi:hypothetical protein